MTTTALAHDRRTSLHSHRFLKEILWSTINN